MPDDSTRRLKMTNSRHRPVFLGVVKCLGIALLPLLLCGGCTRTEIADFSPKSGMAGDKVRIDASLCSGVWLEGVWFNDVRADGAVIAKGRRAILASVPEGASTGPIRVRLDTGVGKYGERHIEHIFSENFFVGEVPEYRPVVGEVPGDSPVVGGVPKNILEALRPRIMSFTATANTVLEDETMYSIRKGDSLELKWDTRPSQLSELDLIGPGGNTSVLGKKSMTVSPPAGTHTYKLIAWKDGVGAGAMLTVRVRE